MNWNLSNLERNPVLFKLVIYLATPMNIEVHAPGKLLISGEYVILDGAWGYAVTTNYGQLLQADLTEDDWIHWESFDHKGGRWFKCSYSLSKNKITDTTDDAVSDRLLAILQSIGKGCNIRVHLDFPANWGLGSSSTLVACVARAFGLDPYELLRKTFGGSGYDVAVGMHARSLFYRLQNGMPEVRFHKWRPAFSEELFFVHLNEKRNSRDAIKSYNQHKDRSNCLIEDMSDLTEAMISTDDRKEFESLTRTHEKIIAGLISQPRIREERFHDYPHEIKSLGAWGGDFIMAVGEPNDKNYFRDKGYRTILSFEEMVGT